MILCGALQCWQVLSWELYALLLFLSTQVCVYYAVPPSLTAMGVVCIKEVYKIFFRIFWYYLMLTLQSKQRGCGIYYCKTTTQTEVVRTGIGG